MHESNKEVRKGVLFETLANVEDSERRPRAELLEALPEGEAMRNAVMNDVLGEPLSIRDVARLIGCSVWTVRQQCLRQGLPHFRMSRTGRLIFYRNQVIRWLIHNQKERRF